MRKCSYFELMNVSSRCWLPFHSNEDDFPKMTLEISMVFTFWQMTLEISMVILRNEKNAVKNIP